MKTTLNLKDDLIQKARELTGIKEKTLLIHMGLTALISKVSRERLIKLGGSDKTARVAFRRKS
ncbi:MAG: type II toxin-antitoxin system VapB family antitoxin [Deltaproteobacteria bacterium]|nr:type II toxin-antitoxin system VapB family antitoxin [Deltaproteobacteria bacterium]